MPLEGRIKTTTGILKPTGLPKYWAPWLPCPPVRGSRGVAAKTQTSLKGQPFVKKKKTVHVCPVVVSKRCVLWITLQITFCVHVRSTADFLDGSERSISYNRQVLLPVTLTIMLNIRTVRRPPRQGGESNTITAKMLVKRVPRMNLTTDVRNQCEYVRQRCRVETMK